jgi:hypothetical protein
VRKIPFNYYFYFPKNNNPVNKFYLLTFVALLLITGSAYAQPSFGGQPLGLAKAISLPEAPLFALPALDTKKLLREDALSQANRFAAPIALDIDLNSHGDWTYLPDGTQVWQLRITVAQAKGLLLFYEDFNLPPDSRLFVYSPNTKQVLGAYTAASQSRSDRFMTGIIEGDELVVEYQTTADNYDAPFHIWRIDAVYKDAGPEKNLLNFGFGSSSECHDNVGCPTGEEWQLERNAVARIIVAVEEGTGYCTGTVMNNTAGDGRLLFLSAFHCMDGYTPEFDLWRFDFYYEGEDCENPLVEPEFRSILGCDSLAGRRAVDFLLLDLYPETTIGMEFHYMGWDRSGTPPDSSALLHHPRGDIKKISLAENPATVWTNSIQWNNGVTTPPNHHYRVPYTDGIIEVGSSGAALLDQNHRVVGQLHGDAGINNCDDAVGYFGRMFMAWEGANEAFRLKDWLDPLGTDTMFIDALGQIRSVVVRTDQDDPVVGVTAEFRIDGELIGTATTLEDGRLFIPAEIPTSGTLTVSLNKDDAYNNGVTTADLIKMQRHVLGTEFMTPYRILACDVNLSNSISTLDMIRIRKLILTLTPDFGEGSVPSWQFISATTSFSDPLQPWPFERGNSFSYTLSPGFQLSDFIAMKSGDANGNANPGN